MKNISILIVEDEPIIATDLANQLSKLDYNIVGIAESGQAAIDAALSHLPDIVLMDIRLEGDIDGIDTAREIAKNLDSHIIFLTSNADQKTFDRAKLTKPHSFLSKPFRIMDIIHSIDLAMQKSQEMRAIVNPIESAMKDRVFIREGTLLYKVNHTEILYIEADSSYSKIYTGNRYYLVPGINQ